MINHIITGEKIQQLCDIYIGKKEDFFYNPIIKIQKQKHVCIEEIHKEYNNPYIIFCYTHLIDELSLKINYFKNKFILITHNSDKNIESNENVNNILNCKNLVRWFCQNLCVENDRLHILPIGFANKMWPHGNLEIFNDVNVLSNSFKKTNLIYFNFNINTNLNKRKICYESMKDKLSWLENINPVLNLYRLNTYQFCICPEGNGVDTHRLWECLYLKVVPIVIDSLFTQTLLRYNIPLVVLNNWNDIIKKELIYENYNFDDILFKSLLNYNKLIELIKS